MTVAQLEPWMDTGEIASFFGCSPRTIRYWRAEGMPYATIANRPKHRPSECEAWLERAGHLRRSA